MWKCQTGGGSVVVALEQSAGVESLTAAAAVPVSITHADSRDRNSVYAAAPLDRNTSTVPAKKAQRGTRQPATAAINERTTDRQDKRRDEIYADTLKGVWYFWGRLVEQETSISTVAE